MIERRDLLRGLAVGAALTSSQAASACSLATYDDDAWGQRLVDFLRGGNARLLDGLFKDHSTLVAFRGDLIGSSDQLEFRGGSAVGDAMIRFRKQQTSRGIGDTPRILQQSVIVGSKQQGRMNKIELLFAEKHLVETSCGPTRSEQSVDLYFEAGVHETGNDWVKWSIQHIALIPRLETERYPAGA